MKSERNTKKGRAAELLETRQQTAGLEAAATRQGQVAQSVRWNRMWLLVAGMFVLLGVLVWLDEILDLPHLLLGAPATPLNWREATIETTLIAAVAFFTVSRLIHDVTERKRAEERIEHLNLVLRAIRGVNQLIIREKDRGRLVQGACDNLIETRGYYGAWVTLLSEAGGLVTAAEAGWGEGFLPVVDQLRRGEVPDCGRMALSQPSVVVTKDPPATCADCPLSVNCGGRGTMTVRLEHGEKIYGLMSVSIPADFTADEEERSLFKEVAGDIAFALYGIELEDKRRRAEEAAQKSAERYRSLFESVPMGLYRTTPEGRILHVNSTLVQMLGYPDRKALMAINVTDGYVNAEECQRWQATIEREGGVSGFESQWRCYDGTTIWVRETARAIRDAEGRVVRYDGAVEDITARKQAEEQARQQERLAAVGQLAGGIAHDFNNLLTTIILYAQMPLGKQDLPPDVTRAFETILAESRRAAELVRQILDFSRRSPIETRPLDLKPFVKEAVRVLERTIPESISLLLEVAPGEYVVNADPTRVQQVLMNLAVNARDAMTSSSSVETPEGGKLRVELARVEVKPDESPPVEEMPVGKWVCLAVSDTGTGIAPEVLPHVFEPFYTTKGPGEGAGLGLAQVYGIVKQHEGYIGVETEVGKGTTFRVYLPAHRGEAMERAEAEEDSIPLQGQGETILLVEDSERIREAGREVLESLGYRVLVAANGREALEVHEAEGGVDLVITDLVMPEMGGRRLVRELRKATSDLKALAITGHAVEEDLRRLRKEGFLDIIYKPLDVHKLATAVRQALDED